LLIMGIGADSFFLNEYLADTTTMLDFETLARFPRGHAPLVYAARGI